MQLESPEKSTDDPYFISQRGGAIAWALVIVVRDSFENGINYVSLMGSGKIDGHFLRFRLTAQLVVFICSPEDNISISFILSGTLFIDMNGSFANTLGFIGKYMALFRFASRCWLQ